MEKYFLMTYSIKRNNLTPILSKSEHFCFLNLFDPPLFFCRHFDLPLPPRHIHSNILKAWKMNLWNRMHFNFGGYLRTLRGTFYLGDQNLLVPGFLSPIFFWHRPPYFLPPSPRPPEFMMNAPHEVKLPHTFRLNWWRNWLSSEFSSTGLPSDSQQNLFCLYFRYEAYLE